MTKCKAKMLLMHFKKKKNTFKLLHAALKPKKLFLLNQYSIFFKIIIILCIMTKCNEQFLFKSALSLNKVLNDG